MQASGTTAPDLPPVPSRHEYLVRDHEYVRHGTLSLLGRHRSSDRLSPPWIPERSATCLREADLNVLSKLGNQGLEWRLVNRGIYEA